MSTCSFVISVEGHFDAAHFLPKHAGKCKNLHGHRWNIRLLVSSTKLNRYGMVLDFGRLKEIMTELVGKLDHVCLNDKMRADPTAENIAKHLYKKAKKLLPNWPISIVVAESPGCEVKYGEI